MNDKLVPSDFFVQVVYRGWPGDYKFGPYDVEDLDEALRCVTRLAGRDDVLSAVIVRRER